LEIFDTHPGPLKNKRFKSSFTNYQVFFEVEIEKLTPRLDAEAAGAGLRFLPAEQVETERLRIPCGLLQK
jgi:hypothetical protein